MGHPADGLAALFIIGDSAPQHEAYGAIKNIERAIS